MKAGQLHSSDMPQNTSESDTQGIQECDFDDTESQSENEEGASGEGQDRGTRKRKSYHRHSTHQIEQMEAFFKECQNPDHKQRKAFSECLGLTPLQVKFWFQNKRSQLKVQHERNENSQLRAENEKLKAENGTLRTENGKLGADNMAYSEVLGNVLCSNCGGPSSIGEMSFGEHQLRLENARLRAECDKMCVANMGKPMVGPLVSPSYVPPPPPQLRINGNNGSIGGINPIIKELVIAAMKEFVVMAQTSEPLWFTSMDGTTTVLNENEYNRRFPQLIGPMPAGFKHEASRQSAVVFMDHIKLIEILMDVNKWSEVFSGIVSSAMTREVETARTGEPYSGALQLMAAEFQIPSSLMPTRGSSFIRICNKLAEGIWAVMDVSWGEFLPNSSVMSCRKRPSGCLIQPIPNGYSQVTWVEHVEVDDSRVHNLFKQLVNSGQAFGAKRWMTTLNRQCERLACSMGTTIPIRDVGVINYHGRKNMLKMAERMVLSFCNSVNTCHAHSWKTLSGTHGVRVMTYKSENDPGRPSGLILCATTSLQLPYSPTRVFEFLFDRNSRSEWDIVCKGAVVEETTRIATGRNTGSCVSALRLNNANEEQQNLKVLQESWVDSTGSYVVFAPVGVETMNALLAGVADPNYMPILPSGYAVLPDGSTTNICSTGRNGGSILTMAFQVYINAVPRAEIPVGMIAHVNNAVVVTIENIKAALSRRVA